MFTKRNIGNADKIIRFAAALVFAVLYLTGIIPGFFGIALVALAVIFIATGFVRFCPLYYPFGISTMPKPKQ
jgi:hypothetical protein